MGRTLSGHGMLPVVEKFRVVTVVQGRLLNPLVRALVRRVPVPGWALLETTGRRTGLPRTTPVGDGLVGSTFWIVAEHGRRAAYVRNIEADPRVRWDFRKHHFFIKKKRFFKNIT